MPCPARRALLRFMVWMLPFTVLAGLVAWLSAGHTTAPAVRTGITTTAPAVAASAAVASAPIAPAAAPDVPLGVPADEWAQVVAAERAQPGGAQDLPRIGEYLSFQHRVARWQQLRTQGDNSPERLQLAHDLLDALPLHVGRKEVTAFEAKTLSAQFLADLVPDATQRQQAMQQETQRLEAAQPVADRKAMQQEQVRMAAYKQREAEITAQWMALAPAARDPQWLESQLDAARRATLGSDTTAN